MDKIPQPDPLWNGKNPDPGTSFAPYKIYNIGNNNPVDLMEFINVLESFREVHRKFEENRTEEKRMYEGLIHKFQTVVNDLKKQDQS